MKKILYLVLLGIVISSLKAMDLSQAPTSIELDLSDPKKREMVRESLLAALNGQNRSNFKQELLTTASTQISVQTTGNAKVSVAIESSNTITTIIKQ